MFRKLSILFFLVFLAAGIPVGAFTAEAAQPLNIWFEHAEQWWPNPFIPYNTFCVYGEHFIYLHWAPPEEGDICYYRIYKDGVVLGDVNKNSASAAVVTLGGGYCDEAGGIEGAYVKFKTSIEATLAAEFYGHTFKVEAVRACYGLPNLVLGEILATKEEEPPASQIDPTKTPDQSKVTTVAEPINVANGNMFTTVSDIAIPGVLPLELSRTYNSQDDFNGSLGYDWRSNFDITLTEQPDSSVIEVDNTGVYTIYTKQPDGSYTPSAGKYSTLVKNSDATFTLTRKSGNKLYFNPSGLLTKIEDRNSNQINILRDANGLIQEVSDSFGRKLLFISDPEGKIIEVKDSSRRSFKYEYDLSGNLIKTIDPAGHQTFYSYDANHNLTQSIDANNHSLFFEYDSDDRAYHSWQDNQNNEVTLVFDPANKTTISIDSLGNVTKYEYNTYGLVTKITDAQNKIQTFVWDDALSKTSSTDKNGNTTSFSYDTKGNLLSLRDPLNNVTAFTYTPDFNQITLTTDPLGNTTEYTYDLKGNLIQIKDALNSITTYTYNALGQLIQAKDANNNITTFTYDTFGNLGKTTDALNNSTLFTYDTLGNLIQTTDALGGQIQFTYDLLNRLTRITYPDTSKVIYTYDLTGNLISFIDPNNNTTTYSYDAVNRLIQTTDAQGNSTQYTYDTEGNRTSITDANQNKIQYFYDSLNRLIKTKDPLNHQALLTYDPNGNLIAKTDANGNTINYTYDKNNRLIQISYPDTSTVSFSYDALGRRTAILDYTGTTNYSYNALSRLLQIDGPKDNDTISYAYDNLGNRIQMTDQDGRVTAYTYDSLNRLISLIDPRSKTTAYSYDPVNNLIRTDYANHTQTNYAFDNLNRLTALANEGDNGIISSYAYDYNSSGMRTKVTLADRSYILYSYDALNRLTAEQKYNRNNKIIYSLKYAYDTLGNRLTQETNFTDRSFKIKGFPREAFLEYLYNPDNQLTQLKVFKKHKKDKSTLFRTTDFIYGQNGNLIQEVVINKDGQIHKTKSYAYDFENRLLQFKSTDADELKTLDFTYDGLGRRIAQTVTETEEGESETKTDLYFYDGLNTIIERDENNLTQSSYLRGLSHGGGIGSIISETIQNEEDKEKEFYYHYDGIGSVTALTDAQAKLKASYTYDAFGNILKQHGSKGINPYGFSTKELDESGLVYFGARYYNPKTGRWITQDPMGMIDGPNMYTYVNNNPFNATDPYGLYTLVIHGLGHHKVGYTGDVGKALKSSGENVSEVFWSGHIYDSEAFSLIRNEIKQASQFAESRGESLNIISHSWGGILAGSALRETGIKANWITLGTPYFNFIRPKGVRGYVNFIGEGDIIAVSSILNLTAAHFGVINEGSSFFDIHSYWNNAEVVNTISRALGLNKGKKK